MNIIASARDNINSVVNPNIPKWILFSSFFSSRILSRKRHQLDSLASSAACKISTGKEGYKIEIAETAAHIVDNALAKVTIAPSCLPRQEKISRMVSTENAQAANR